MNSCRPIISVFFWRNFLDRAFFPPSDFNHTYLYLQKASPSPTGRHHPRSCKINGAANAADRKRKFFQRKNTNSAPNSSNENSFDHSGSPSTSSSNFLTATKTTRSISASSPRGSSCFSDSAVSRALEEALRTTAILGWEAAGDCCIEESPSPVMTSRTSLNSVTFDLHQDTSFSKSSPSTTNSSPKGGRPRGNYVKVIH